MKRLVESYKGTFATCTAYTTRPPLPHELDGRDYHFTTLEKLNSLILKGEIVEVYKFNNHLYGLTLENIEDVAVKGKFCLLSFGMEVRL